jgi:pimeloyl-ACP methyl ester carboxylesterase
MGSVGRSAALRREAFRVAVDEGMSIALQRQQATGLERLVDVLYVHGATFGADLSIFFELDGRSWADELAAAGYNVWGFDFVGYGLSDRYPESRTTPAGNFCEAALQLQHVVTAVRERNGNRPVVLLGHSRGGTVAARHAADRAQDVAALVLFAPIVMRPALAPAPEWPSLPAHSLLSAWAQYRRFVEDVPRGEPQVLSEEHADRWAQAFIATDAGSAARSPPAVLTPNGPSADIRALWSGKTLYDPTAVSCPTLLVRGEWDTRCTDEDAARLMHSLCAAHKRDVKLTRATHLMHLEEQRTPLYAVVHRFLGELQRCAAS